MGELLGRAAALALLRQHLRRRILPDIRAHRAPIHRLVGIPVRAVPDALATAAATSLATIANLLVIGNLVAFHCSRFTFSHRLRAQPPQPSRRPRACSPTFSRAAPVHQSTRVAPPLYQPVSIWQAIV